ncbi:DUF4381 family protein [Methylorubrum rhodesianum]|uniref:DUF4381 family protein n=1 Tax=Methylorubrum rhodesianum TaxID=29427 RepID=A0ABU9Z748_9HYPH|nr:MULTISPECIES: DUF4381 family protein [Methylorubrum]MBB5763588.1 hypothetical protein [Methylorubrum rhodesianum]MBI1689858.1 DUF4381 domain-containing protein [Methylorubrum sp. DB1722]MBK3402192.1 DUF4381 domain-containing protein [Methylorubrum rhodesianum]MBY0140174.1 DUF4381 domain-containing protein [Methylorubrum populi]
MTATPDLSALRGLHLPTGGSGAVQPEMVAAIVLSFGLALLVGGIRLLRARRGASLRRAALRELALAARLEPEARRVAQARLLRRVVRTLKGEEAARARGPAWAATLDATFGTDFFRSGPGRVFADDLYRRPEAVDPTAIDAGLGRMLAQIRA